MIEQKDPFGYSLGTYLWVFGLALVGGAVKYLNTNGPLNLLGLVRDLVTAGFIGLCTFWFCEWQNINGPLSAILIATSGFMGTRAIKEVENLYRLRLGLPMSNGENKSETAAGSTEPAEGPQQGN